MDPDHPAAPSVPPPPTQYTQEDLLLMENPQVYSSIGKTLLSTRPSAPQYGFGTSTRAQHLKVFQNKQLVKTQFVGKTGPGPVYNVHDKVQYPKAPSWGFGTGRRTSPNPSTTQHLNTSTPQPPNSSASQLLNAGRSLENPFADPLSAEQFRRRSAPRTAFGRATRFATEAKPALEPQPGELIISVLGSLGGKFPSTPLFSFGFRRETKGRSALTRPTSTPISVGPATYDPSISTLSTHLTAPRIGFPKRAKLTPLSQQLSNQTFEVYSSIGHQLRSAKITMPAVGVGKGSRANPPNRFKADLINAPESLRLPHAAY